MNTRSRRASGRLILAALAPLAAAPAAAQVGVTVQWLYPVEMLYISDFTPHSVGQHPDLLAVTLVNGTSQPQQLVLRLDVRMEQPSNALIFAGETNPFTLSGSARRLTNRDLATSGRDVSLEEYDIGGGATSLRDQILETGRFPSGTYAFRVSVRTATGIPLGSGEARVELTNPTRVDLLSPGMPVGQAPPLITTPAPRFLWSSDGGPTSTGVYKLQVVRADGAASAEEAMQGFAAWQTTTSSTSAVYPGSASALRLEPGATYAWQVTREIRTTGGVELVQSPIYWFRMAETGPTSIVSAGADEGAADRMRRLLETLGLGSDLADFRPVALTVDGREIGIDGLEELLAAISAGEVAVLSLRVR